MQTVTLTPTPPEQRAAEARYQDDLAAAEEHYAATLASLGLESKARDVSLRAASHRARAARLRRGGA